MRPIKNLLWMFHLILLATAVVSRGVAAPDPTTVVAAPTVKNLDLVEGSTFYIDITVADVERMFGYQFILSYNTTVLTATDYAPYDPFTYPWPSELNDTAGYVAMTYSMEMPETVGFSTVDPAPIARIDFTVDALGESDLDLQYSPPLTAMLTNLDAELIPHDVVDGYFANIITHDVAITDVTSPSTVLVNQTADVTVTVENLGDASETFDVSVYYDAALIETQTDVSLAAGADTTLTFTWDTTGVAEGTYTITANASVVPGETKTGNNVFVDGEVTIVLTAVHDVAVTSVTASPSEVVIGGSVSISVTVANEGNMGETFDVSVYYDSTSIGTQTGVSLLVGASKSLTFTWDTTDVDLDTYTITASASVVSGETDTADNTGTDEVTVKEEPGPNLVLYAVAGIVIIVVVAIAVYALRARKPKPT